MLPSLIHTDQSGFLKGRSISDNLRKILDIMEYTSLHNIPALFVSVDFEKAFDRVHYDSLFLMLERFNFGPIFISWLRLLFSGIQLHTVNNGYVSKPLSPTRGLFQGNPIAPYLFLIQIELLGILIRKNDKIKGIKIGDYVNLLTKYADDLGLFLLYDQCTWQEVEKTLLYFEQISGMKINYNKTIVYRIGSL